MNLVVRNILFLIGFAGICPGCFLTDEDASAPAGGETSTETEEAETGETETDSDGDSAGETETDSASDADGTDGTDSEICATDDGDCDGVSADFDCDDADGSAWEWACPDADGDSFCAVWDREQWRCVGESVDSGYTAVSDWSQAGTDCDDEDPDRQRYIYADADRDGDVSITPHGCVSVDEWAAPSEGFSSLSGRDCDDADPAFAIFRPDLQGDGTDQNCDGRDEADGENWLYLFPGDPLESSCESGADPAVLAAVSIRGCFSIGWALLANIGDAPYEGTTRIVYNDGSYPVAGAAPTVETGRFEIFLSLLPGEQVWMQIGEGVETIGIEPTEADCDPGNNTFSAEDGFTDCLR